jgi:hypothetical protein
MLFPQVAAAGRLLIAGAGVGIGEFACATRAHPDQLGFRHLTGSRRPGERHGVEEVLELFEDLETDAPALRDVRPLIESELTRQYRRNMPNERVLAGRVVMTRNFVHLMRNRRSRAHRLLPWTIWASCVLLPTAAIKGIKRVVRYAVARHRLAPAGLRPGQVLGSPELLDAS